MSSSNLTGMRRTIHASGMSDEVIKAPKNKGGRPKGVKRAASKLRQHEIALITTDYARGMKQHEIAKKFGVSEASVSGILKKFEPFFAELGNVESYRQAKADILDSASLSVLKEISNPTKILDSDLRSLSVSFDILNKHSRLERNLSTQNIATQTQINVKMSSDYDEQ